MLSERNYWRHEVLGCILFKVIVLPTLETVRDICWLANLPEISNTVKTTMKTKMARSPTMPAVSHSGFLKFLTRFHKKSTHRNLLRSLMYKTQKDLQQRSHHSRPQIPSNPWISHSHLCRSKKNFTKLMQPFDPSAHDLQILKIASPKTVVRASTGRHRLAMTNSLAPQNCANLLTVLEN